MAFPWQLLVTGLGVTESRDAIRRDQQVIEKKVRDRSQRRCRTEHRKTVDEQLNRKRKDLNNEAHYRQCGLRKKTKTSNIIKPSPEKNNTT